MDEIAVFERRSATDPGFREDFEAKGLSAF